MTDPTMHASIDQRLMDLEVKLSFTEDLVDRILIYRAPIIVGEGKSSFGYVGLVAINDAHGRWRLVDEKRLGVDRLEVYERIRDR